MIDNYLQKVADYYDEEASSFEERAGENHILEQLRGRFREVVLDGPVSQLLEIGYGPGLDMIWFVEQPQVDVVYGLDITPEFHKIVEVKSSYFKDGVIQPHLGSPKNAPEIVGVSSIDTVYVFFGALNTTPNLEKSLNNLAAVLKPGGRMVLTFVNKWYLFDILWNFATFRPKKAVSRLRKNWGGYSPSRYLESRCYSARAIHQAMPNSMTKRYRRGYCIVQPAWYRKQWAPSGSVRSSITRGLDNFLQWTPFWNTGEYSLYVYEKSE